MNSTNFQYDPKTEEAGEARLYCRFKVGATGVVPTFPDNFVRVSANISGVTRVSAGKYKFLFDSFFVPGYSAANQNSQMGSNTGAAPTLEVNAQIFGNNAVYGTDATYCRVIADNTNNQDASGVSFITIECDAPGVGAVDPAQNDELVVVFTLKTERP